MPIATFTPPVQPSPGSKLTPEFSLNKTPFGDGYTQNSPNGINHIRRKLSIKWEALTLTEHNTIRDFLIAQQGYLPFYYTHPTDNVLRKWTCENFDLSLTPPYAITAEFVESFSLLT